MQIEQIIRTKLTASEGTVLTNGTEFGRIIYLAEGAYTSDWYEIPESEYEKILAEQEKANQPEHEII